MRTGIGFVIWLALVAAASASDYAFIIGVNHCPRFVLPDGSKPRPLRAAEADADAMADLVVDKFRFPAANVVVLKG